jgi:V8-like Glu-specific endopeptidase
MGLNPSKKLKIMKRKYFSKPGKLIVIPGNTPQCVVDTSHAPYKFVGLLEMTFPDGETFIGTGTLIEDGTDEGNKSFHVLTCAHNLFSKENKGRAVSVSFTPGYNGDSLPNRIQASEFHYPKEFEKNEDSMFDYAVVRLARAADAKGTYFTYVLSDEELKNVDAQLNGYGFCPPDGEGMSHAIGKITEVEQDFLLYPITTDEGASGTAVIKTDGMKIVGVHIEGVREKMLNKAVRITQTVQANIQKWLAL